LATPRGLSAGLGLPAAGVCTLDAVALGIAEAGAEGARLAVLDGWRGEAFAALYDARGKRGWERAVGLAQRLAERVAELGEPPSAAGSGAVRFRQELTRV